MSGVIAYYDRRQPHGWVVEEDGEQWPVGPACECARFDADHADELWEASASEASRWGMSWRDHPARNVLAKVPVR
jgi:hypothetical protein